MSEEDIPEAKTEQPIIVTKLIDLLNPNLQKGKSFVMSLITVEISSDVPESGASRIFFKKCHLHHSPLKDKENQET